MTRDPIKAVANHAEESIRVTRSFPGGFIVFDIGFDVARDMRQKSEWVRASILSFLGHSFSDEIWSEIVLVVVLAYNEGCEL